ncbi:hypothetical protein TcasGA2_TC014745 [Tribolium castaneum]|uniref:Uncharacterized protein n=1 Tax=Tribolium castaneum TaxID=7070 RepID=D6WJ93_TRICA|nr:hypothetical protein TcasGA2_TC014745 [Tribolium castaneum]
MARFEEIPTELFIYQKMFWRELLIRSRVQVGEVEDPINKVATLWRIPGAVFAKLKRSSALTKARLKFDNWHQPELCVKTPVEISQFVCTCHVKRPDFTFTKARCERVAPEWIMTELHTSCARTDRTAACSSDDGNRCARRRKIGSFGRSVPNRQFYDLRRIFGDDLHEGNGCQS